MYHFDTQISKKNMHNEDCIVWLDNRHEKITLYMQYHYHKIILQGVHINNLTTIAYMV